MPRARNSAVIGDNSSSKSLPRKSQTEASTPLENFSRDNRYDVQSRNDQVNLFESPTLHIQDLQFFDRESSPEESQMINESEENDEHFNEVQKKHTSIASSTNELHEIPMNEGGKQEPSKNQTQKKSNVGNDYRLVYRQGIKNVLLRNLVLFNKHNGFSGGLAKLIMADTLGGIIFAFRNFQNLEGQFFESLLELHESENISEQQQGIIEIIFKKFMEIDYRCDSNIQTIFKQISREFSKVNVKACRMKKKTMLKNEEKLQKGIQNEMKKSLGNNIPKRRKLGQAKKSKKASKKISKTKKAKSVRTVQEIEDTRKPIYARKSKKITKLANPSQSPKPISTRKSSRIEVKQMQRNNKNSRQ